MMAFNGGHRKVWDFGVINFSLDINFTGKIAQTAAKHNANFRLIRVLVFYELRILL